jgi:hypothetical protein
VKLPLDWPAAIVMLAGTVTKLLVLDRVTSAPPEGAAMFNVTVPVDGFPLTTVLGFIVILDTANTAGPHWPGTPRPRMFVLESWCSRRLSFHHSHPAAIRTMAPRNT